MNDLTKTMDTGRELLASLMEKCHEDDNFKNKLLTNPVAAIEEFTGKKYQLPEGKELRITDQTDERYIYVNIPRKFNVDDLELTDAELEQVAGGFWSSVAAGLVAAAIYDFASGVVDGFRA